MSGTARPQRHNVRDFTPDKLVRLESRLQIATLPDNILVTWEQRAYVIDVIGKRVQKTWDRR